MMSGEVDSCFSAAKRREVGLQAPNCGNNDCDIFDLVVDPLDCNDDGTYNMVINFQYENPGNDFFDLYNILFKWNVNGVFDIEAVMVW